MEISSIFNMELCFRCTQQFLLTCNFGSGPMRVKYSQLGSVPMWSKPKGSITES